MIQRILWRAKEASIRVFMFTASFRSRPRFANFVNIAFLYCTAVKSKVISTSFRKTFRNEGLHQTVKKRKIARMPEPNNSQLSFFLRSLLCPLFLLLFPMNFRFCLISVPRFAKWPFPRTRKGFFVTRRTREFGVAFHWSAAWPHWHAWNEVRKLWFFCFHASYLYLNEFMAFVDLLDFHENWPECGHSWDNNAQSVWSSEEIRNISLVTSRNVTTTEIFPWYKIDFPRNQ